jgi:hypothetical protein
MSLEPDNVLRWTPTADQLGPIDVPVQCQDAAEPPQAVNGDLGFRIVAPDPCVTLACDPATGCTATTLPISQSCCTDLQRPRLAEAAVLCPQGRLLQIGRNTDGFGRLNSCDHMRFRQRAQADADPLPYPGVSHESVNG